MWSKTEHERETAELQNMKRRQRNRNRSIVSIIHPVKQQDQRQLLAGYLRLASRDHVDGQPTAPGRRRRRAHRSGRGCRAPLLGRGRQPRAAGPGHPSASFLTPLLLPRTY